MKGLRDLVLLAELYSAQKQLKEAMVMSGRTASLQHTSPEIFNGEAVEELWKSY